MKKIYFKITWNGIKNNIRLYIPYIVACSLMVCLSHILLYLSNTISINDSINIVQGILRLGFYLIWIFSLIFLLYTNSVIQKSRLSEYGLYNLLGFSKRNLKIIALYETIFLYIASIIIGLFTGALFSKLSEIVFAKICQQETSFDFYFYEESFTLPIIMFAIIFLITLLKSFRTIRKTSALNLLKEQQMREKPPKASWFIGFLGLVGIGISFYFAVFPPSLHPFSIILNFFLCAIGVVVSTYLIFVSLSVVVCKILQKNKNFYYKKNHFTSVSTLSFRMKKNGAGLATISIFLTIIFICATTAICLFSTCEKGIDIYCPQDAFIKINCSKDITVQDMNLINTEINHAAEVNDISLDNKISLDYFDSARATISEEKEASLQEKISVNFNDTNNTQVTSIGLNCFNVATGSNIKIGDDEIVAYAPDTISEIKYLVIDNTKYNIIQGSGSVPKTLNLQDFSIPNILFVYNDNNTQVKEALKKYSVIRIATLQFDCDTTTDNFNNFNNDVQKIQIPKSSTADDSSFYTISTQTRTELTQSVYGNGGGLVYMTVLLSIVFFFAIIIILYYKQLSEGYEDVRWFQSLKKIGMSKRDIKKSVNSQVLIVFMMPIVFSIITTFFASSLVAQMIGFLGISKSFAMFVELCVMGIGAILYIIIYKLTSKSYYSIVSKS